MRNGWEFYCKVDAPAHSHCACSGDQSLRPSHPHENGGTVVITEQVVTVAFPHMLTVK